MYIKDNIPNSFTLDGKECSVQHAYFPHGNRDHIRIWDDEGCAAKLGMNLSPPELMDLLGPKEIYVKQDMIDLLIPYLSKLGFEDTTKRMRYGYGATAQIWTLK
tara:strand:+ start:1988 stop:2299 length:312 start_codon:yes stop_codon:yes gene_type:complete